MVDDSEREGVSRRKVLKGAAAAGAIVWATPVIQTINAASARAQATPPPGEEVCYTVKVNTSGTCQAEQNPNGYQCIPLAPPGHQGNSDCSFVSSTPRTPNNDSGVMTVTLAEGCELVEGYSKCGQTGCTPPQSLGNNMYLFTPCPGSGSSGGGISHLEISFCCPSEDGE